MVFAAATLAITSVVLLILQRPWTGKKLGAKQAVKVVVQSLLLCSSFVLWAGGLLLCGPATTVMLEYTEVMLLRMGRSMSSRGGRGRSARLMAAGKPLGVLATICILLAMEGLGRHGPLQPQHPPGPVSSFLGINRTAPASARMHGGGSSGDRHIVRQPWGGEEQEWAEGAGGHAGKEEGNRQHGRAGTHTANPITSALPLPSSVGTQPGLLLASQDTPPVAAVIAHELAIADLDGRATDEGQRREWEVFACVCVCV